MTAAGLRSLFRYHRRSTGIKLANPHRFRHTFASDMVREGVSLPALMHLMGHAQIQTTARYDRRGEATKKRAARLLHVPYRGR